MPSDDSAAQTTIFTEPVERIQCSQCGHIVDMRGSEPFSERFCPSCGARKKVPARLGTYLLLDCIGSGGMGAVFRGLDPSLDRVVAVKVMNRALGQDPAALAAFRKEARAAARFNHPHAAQVFTFGESHGQPYIVMEFVTGRPINELVKASGTLDQALVVRVGMQTAEALAVAATSDLLHGDVKPENILVDEDGQSKLIDFGLAAFAEQQSGGQIWGSPYYLAPERILRQKTDFRTDIYSLGATLYEALTGRPPFVGDDIRQVLNAHLAGNPTAVSVYRRDLDPEIERIVMRMIRRQPSERYPNYDSLTGDLRRTLNRLGGYPGRGRRLAPHGGTSSIRVRSEPGALGSSLREARDPPAVGLRAIPDPPSHALREVNDAPSPGLREIPDRGGAPRSAAASPRPPSKRVPASWVERGEARDPAPSNREAPSRRAEAPAPQARREARPMLVRQDSHTPQKATPAASASRPHREPNVVPFMVILGVIALVALVVVGGFLASQPGSSQPATGTVRPQPDGRPPGQTPSGKPAPPPRAGSEQAADDAASTKQGRSVTINVLDNDAVGADGKPPVIVAITNPKNGYAAVQRNSIGYRPQPAFSGSDQFQYTVRYPSGQTSTATVSIEVGGN